MISFTFEEKIFLKNNFRVLDKELLINKIRSLEIEEENKYLKKELKEFKNNLLEKISALNESDLEKLFNEI
ncbi:hypothetical protein P5F43_14955 [Clostridium perfringens]|uniref:hypothetical protein n=1 Tax=Clostridium TaxID=1485 RepID=UPI000D9612ED|nr:MULTISPECIES: hypothetical protein [Clostridium]ELC8368303.1 hypothetical protein [Clostridium perfringens]MCX0403544.1 hypothetical protein [Clostridium perfringens]MDK0888279.1 hypothetical protein [Clostridium perfringens]PWX25769.1 hypothetical protein CYK95_12870 [Clostridium perfringens]WVM62263.1 hypothetical protein V1657_15860 [Clostridium perfringens]